MGRGTDSVPTRPATLFGDIMAAIYSMLNSRLGIAGIGIVLLLCGFGWHKMQVGYLDHKIANLKTEKIEEQNQRKVCELNLVDVRSALDRQNGLVEVARDEAAAKIAAAEDLARNYITDPDQVERMVTGPAGHEEMNLFFIDLLGRPPP